MDRRFHASHDIGFPLGCRICLLDSLPCCCAVLYDLVLAAGINWPMMQIEKENMRWLYNTLILLLFFMDVIQPV
jgi:hypothetical protein